jgi:hypothetical protein
VCSRSSASNIARPLKRRPVTSLNQIRPPSLDCPAIARIVRPTLPSHRQIMQGAILTSATRRALSINVTVIFTLHRPVSAAPAAEGSERVAG